MDLIIDLCREEEGQGMVEYVLILSIMVVVVVSTLTLLGPKIKSIYVNMNSTIS